MEAQRLFGACSHHDISGRKSNSADSRSSARQPSRQRGPATLTVHCPSNSIATKSSNYVNSRTSTSCLSCHCPVDSETETSHSCPHSLSQMCLASCLTPQPSTWRPVLSKPCPLMWSPKPCVVKVVIAHRTANMPNLYRRTAGAAGVLSTAAQQQGRIRNPYDPFAPQHTARPRADEEDGKKTKRPQRRVAAAKCPHCRMALARTGPRSCRSSNAHANRADSASGTVYATHRPGWGRHENHQGHGPWHHT